MFSFLDAFLGYHQIPMFQSNKEKMAFIMLFGFKNAGTTYQRLMTKIFKPLSGQTMEVYIDDIVVKSKTRVEHA